MAGPYSHLRVLDLTRVLAGPWATQNLGDLGAEVIKIERPGVGDDTRGYGPPFVQDAEGEPTTDAVYFLSTNRNKKSVTLDISTAQGQELLLRLAAKCDVFIENYKVGALARYGIGYEDVRKINPAVIYCSLTGFGQDGPYASRAGYDLLFQGMSGLMSITGESDEVAGGGPQKVGIAVSDILAGMYASLAISAALVHRERTGKGQFIDISLLDAMVAFMTSAGLNWLHAGVSGKRWGTAHPQIAPYQAFEAADGHMLLAIGSDSQFQSFCRVIGHPEWAEDVRFQRNAARVTNRTALVEAVSAVIRSRTRRQWQEMLDPAGVPCGPINDIREVFEEPQVVHRGLQIRLPHVRSGQVHGIASPLRLSESPVTYRSGPPLLGEHTDSVLAELADVDAAQIQRLRQDGVI